MGSTYRYADDDDSDNNDDVTTEWFVMQRIVHSLQLEGYASVFLCLSLNNYRMSSYYQISTTISPEVYAVMDDLDN